MAKRHHTKPKHWTIARAAIEWRRLGNRDLYLQHKRTGAQASIYVTQRGAIAVQLPGGYVAGEFATRREAFNHILARGLKAFEMASVG